MPALSLPQIPHYKAAPPTTADLDYADLATIDLSKTDSVEGRAMLASQNDRIFDIADVPFSGVGEEEKRLYSEIDTENTGWFQAYKLKKFWHVDAGVRDQHEYLNIDRHVDKQGHPEALRPLLPEIREFSRFNHYNVLYPILRLIALSLELPEDALVNIHKCNNLGEAFIRFMKYYPRSAEDEEKTKNVWFKGHTDSGTITFLWSQPVAALQILGADGKWRWVRHVENALVVNAGEAMDFLTGGYYKGTIHRVVQPPPDQREHTRLCVFYFLMADGDVRLIPFRDSPVLQREGIIPRCDDSIAPTMLDWRRDRANAYGRADLKPGQENGVEEETIQGLTVKHYN
ncbi:hypothetical protein ID866_11082 [Astraeus odoratus]|nr:hypothetical protein ID866_11082 [Astraeus odoratus]